MPTIVFSKKCKKFLKEFLDRGQKLKKKKIPQNDKKMEGLSCSNFNWTAKIFRFDWKVGDPPKKNN